MKEFKIDGVKVLSVIGTILTIGSTIVGAVNHKNEQATLKSELKEEIMKDLLSNKQN